jgi:Transposase DDE domain
MRQISELRVTLFHCLDWNKARIECLVQFIQALVLVRTVNLTQIAQAFQTPAKQESSYRRVQRFFSGFSFDMGFIAVLVCRLFTLGEKCVLILDRTNWKWGKIHINILMLSVEHFGMGIPLFWAVLDGGGTSATKDRMKILQRVIKAIGIEKIQVLLADREFIGESWFRFLIEANVPFIIRVRRNSMVEGLRNGSTMVPIEKLVKTLGRRKTLLNHQITLWTHRLWASVEYAKGAREPMLVVSNKQFSNPLKLYRWRWGIETLFECLKSRGFRMEETHMVQPSKIEKLLFVLAIAVCWVHKTGELQTRRCPIVMKKHGRKGKSIFRVGLDLMRRALFIGVDILPKELSILPYLEGLASRRPI